MYPSWIAAFKVKVSQKTCGEGIRGSMLEDENDSSQSTDCWEAKAADVFGNTIEIPSCPKCKSLMNMVIGHKAFMWICTEC